MSTDSLTELELVVMLAVLQAGREAYGVTILEEIRTRAGRRILRPTAYEALRRLERKGLLESRLGEPLGVRGGRARRYYRLTVPGVEAVREARRGWQQMWDGIEEALESAGRSTR